MSTKTIVPVTKYDFVLFIRTPEGSTVELSIKRDQLTNEQREIAADMLLKATRELM